MGVTHGFLIREDISSGVGTVLLVDAVSNLNLVRRDWRNTTVSGSFGVKYCLENCKFKFSAGMSSARKCP